MKPLRTFPACATALLILGLLGSASAFARTVYVANDGAKTVSVIDTATNTASATMIKVGSNPSAIAITPEGKSAYVTNFSEGTVSVIDTATNTVGGSPIQVGPFPRTIAITPDGKTAYVANLFAANVSVIDTATNAVSGPPITVGSEPSAIAITPDGRSAYVANLGSASVSVIDTATNTVSATPIKVGKEPSAIAITPDGRSAYVANFGSESVSVIDTATNAVSGTPIMVGKEPNGIAIPADGRSAYVANFGANSVSVINTVTNTANAGPIAVGPFPSGTAIVPDQPPVAAFAIQSGPIRPGVPRSFDASASKDLDGLIATYAWNFGDGQGQVLGGPTVSHAFASPGTYTVRLTATDAESCSTTFVFTGQSALCSGGPAATSSRKIIVSARPRSAPKVRVRCPRTAKPRGCLFRLQAVSARPKRGAKVVSESAVARVKVKAGRQAIVTLHPKAAFAAKLAAATRILVRETVVAKGASRTQYVRLSVMR